MSYFLTLALGVFAYMSFWFIVSVIKKRNDVADVAWGAGFVGIAWASFAIGGGSGARGVLVGALVTVWGTRLAWHIYTRNRGKAEDYRYREWRSSWGVWFYPRSYLQVYLLQGVLMFLIALPISLINARDAAELSYLDYAGFLVWLVGFFFEVVGDAQLVHFIKNPANKGMLMQSGLWRYTRHPNYFGEVAVWWGLWLIALSVPNGLYGVIGPLTITFFILKVSGVPLLEKKMADRDEFQEYKKKTNMFIPWWPKVPKTNHQEK